MHNSHYIALISRWVFNLVLNSFTVADFLTERGRLFHTLGSSIHKCPITEGNFWFSWRVLQQCLVLRTSEADPSKNRYAEWVFPCEMKWNEMKWNEMKWNEMKWNEMKWNEMKWNEMKWNEMKWNEMKWNEIKSNQINQINNTHLLSLAIEDRNVIMSFKIVKIYIYLLLQNKHQNNNYNLKNRIHELVGLKPETKLKRHNFLYTEAPRYSTVLSISRSLLKTIYQCIYNNSNLTLWIDLFCQ